MLPVKSVLFGAAVLALAAAAAAAPASEAPETAPAKNWVLPLFTSDGHHSMTLRGTEVRPVNADRIDVVEMNMTIFSGEATARIVSIMLSPAATFFPRENRVEGAQSLRVIRFRVNGQIAAEITGEDWTFAQAREKVSIRRHAHVVFREQLTNILK